MSCSQEALRGCPPGGGFKALAGEALRTKATVVGEQWRCLWGCWDFSRGETDASGKI